MKKCPFCGADIEESAVFCLYCMSSLSEKSDITSVPRRKKTAYVVIAVCFVLFLIVGITGAALLSGSGESENVDVNPNGNETASQKITSFEDFSLRAMVSSHKTDSATLWNPANFTLTHAGADSDGDKWKMYSAECYIENVNLRFDFCNDGEEIIARITSLTEDNFNDGVKIAEATVGAVYNYTFTNLSDILTDHDTYPMYPVNESESISVLSELPDSAALTDSGTKPVTSRLSSVFDDPHANGSTMFYELRTRVYEGVEYFDIFILFTAG